MSATIDVQHLSGLSPEMAGEHLRGGKDLVFVAGGSSMWPAMRPNAPVTVEPSSGVDLSPGDRVLIELHEQLVLHRVVHEDGERVLLKGDNNRTPDGWYAREEILGRLPRRRFDRVFALLSRMPGQPIACLWAIWRRVF